MHANVRVSRLLVDRFVHFNIYPTTMVVVIFNTYLLSAIQINIIIIWIKLVTCFLFLFSYPLRYTKP